MKTYKIIQFTSYGSKSLANWKNLTRHEALKLMHELQNLNPDNMFEIVESEEDNEKMDN